MFGGPHGLSSSASVSLRSRGSGLGRLPLAQCEVALNYALLDNPQQNAHQAFLVHLRHGTIHGAKWASGRAVSSLSCATNHLCWAILTAADGSSNPQLTPLDDGVLGPPGPLDVPARALACWSLTCDVVGSDQITTFVSGDQTTLQTVPTASNVFAAAAGPHGVFAAISGAEHSGSVLAISH
jgi:hypothetical protein